MRERACGLETEYALSLERRNGTLRDVDPGLLFKHLESELLARYPTLESDSFGRMDIGGRQGSIDIHEGRFLECGARFYYDTGHLEWATPETRTPQEAVLYELSGERTLVELARAVPTPQQSRLLLVKNNIDYVRGTTYGCHENYQVRRHARRHDEAFQHRLTECLLPFLVTRQIYCGAGRLGERSRGGKPVGFQISQRADFIEQEVSADARSQRALINQRDECLADPERFRRVHLIVGDSNRCSVSSLLKIGTTSLVLQMIEEGGLDDPPTFADPVLALKEISRDLSCRRSVRLKNGRKSTAIEVQTFFLEAAERFFDPRNSSSAEILGLWREALQDLSTDPMKLADRVDWVAKLQHLMEPLLNRHHINWEEVAAWNRLIDHVRSEVGGNEACILSADQYARFQFLVDRAGLEWDAYPAQVMLYYKMRERDLRYHDIDPERSLFSLLERQDLIRTLFDDATISAAQHQPPNSRARVRAEAIRWAHRRGQAAKTLLDWGQVSLPEERRQLQLDDPLSSDESKLIQFLEAAPWLTSSEGMEGEIPIRILDCKPSSSTQRPTTDLLNHLKRFWKW